VERACRDGANVMPPIIEAVKAYATLGEVCDVFRKVWGQYREDGRF
jgi:methylmalonyl-CoA mutase N-terminal domain/subunit